MIPVISLATHEKPGCAPSLIDNILTNSTETLIGAGVLESRVSHHFPIFSVVNCGAFPEEDTDLKKPKYDYCESNMNKFLEDLDFNFLNGMPCSEENFEKFVQHIKDCIETIFRIETEEFQKSRRNFLVNPWITPGIIASVNTKEMHYKQWKKSTSKTNILGDERLYEKYKEFRKKLKYIIRSAKRLFYCRKFESVSGNMKKTWALINELRGKPIFNTEGILTLHHLYVHRTFVELFKVQKHRLPISIYELFDMSYRSNNFSLNLPKLKLDTSRHNFLYNSSLIWNELIGKILEKSDPNPNNIMIPGSSPNSDLSASISLVKKRLKKYLLGLQEVDVPTRPNEWLPLNFCKFSLND